MLPAWDVSWAPTNDGYEVRGKATWLPVGVGRSQVEDESLEAAAMPGLAMVLNLQREPDI